MWRARSIPRCKASTAARGATRAGVALLLLLASCVAFAAAHAQEPLPHGEPGSGPDDAVFSIESPWGPIEYRSARGLRVGDTGLNIGGFTTLEFDRAEGEPGLVALDAVNFLVLFEPVDFFRAFAEMEVGRLFEMETNRDNVSSDPNFNFERLYGDGILADALNLRLGKFQTPVGRWNLVPAEPFTWTAADPVFLERAFDEHTTGGAVFGSAYPGRRVLSYWIYGQFFDPLDPDSDPEPADRSVGARLEYGSSFESWSLGTSFLSSELGGEWSHLVGLDAEWALGPLLLTSELTLVTGDVRQRRLWDVYVQGVYEILPSLYFVARYEHLDAAENRADADLGDVGFTWIPKPWLRLKADYRFSTHQTEEVQRGLSMSFSVLF